MTFENGVARPTTLEDLFQIHIQLFQQSAEKHASSKESVGSTEDKGRSRCSLLYRGETTLDRPLRSTLERGAYGMEFDEIEVKFLRGFQKYANDRIEQNRYFLDHLAIAQHHGLPTRLLDWTHSFMTALHFATQRYPDRDGVIHIIDSSIIAEKYPKHFKSVLKLAKANFLTSEMVDYALKRKFLDWMDVQRRRDERKKRSTQPRADGEDDRYLEFLLKSDQVNPLTNLLFFQRMLEADDEARVLLYEAPSLDSRIVNQSSVFSFVSKFPSRSKNTDPKFSQHESLMHETGAHLKVVIPKELKPRVRDWLDANGTNERAFEPGLTGICKWLARHYEVR